MKLSYKELKNKEKWHGYKLPQFDIEKVIQNTIKEPEWVHFGAGNIFRAFPAVVCQKLLDNGIIKKGIIAVEGYDGEIIEKGFLPYDNLHVAVTLKSNGEIEKTIVASICESLNVETQEGQDFKRLIQIFKEKSLKMVSFTITEKGYALKNFDGSYFEAILEDFDKEPQKAKSYLGRITALINYRYEGGEYPLTLVSMDNCSNNGDRLKTAVCAFADEWEKRGFVKKGFLNYVRDCISYPCTMIDKITPRPSEKVLEILKESGLEDIDAFITGKKTYIAPFVNGEETEYLVIEDDFRNGKIPLDKEGIIYTDRETVEKVEKMKVSTCLNPLHTALAIFGCLLGYKKISDEMKDSELLKLIKKIGYEEGLPVVINPKIIEPKKFIDEVIEKRLKNPFILDTPQRIATDTSQKLGVRFGETIKAYMKKDAEAAKELTYIPLVIAGWLRYLLGIDDEGKLLEISPDPMFGELKVLMEGLKFGNFEETVKDIKSILKRKDIFYVDLCEAGLGDKIEKMFLKMTEGNGAVRKTLKEYL